MVLCLSRGSPEIAVYKKLLNEFSEAWGYHLQIDGSPFEYPHLSEFLSICREVGISDIGVRTGESVTASDIEMLQKHNIRSIMFRLFDQNLEMNLAVTTDKQFSTEVSAVLEQEILERFDEIVRYCEDRSIRLLVLERGIISLFRKKIINPLFPSQYKEIMIKIVRHNKSGSQMGIALSHCPNKILLHPEAAYASNSGGCSAGIISCAVNTNGDIIPCLPLFNMVLGNICENSLKSVWSKSYVLSQLRDRNGLKGKCGKCEYKSSCGGCRAEGYHSRGDLLEEDPTCWLEG